jgi:hypothetical protein
MCQVPSTVEIQTKLGKWKSLKTARIPETARMLETGPEPSNRRDLAKPKVPQVLKALKI